MDNNLLMCILVTSLMLNFVLGQGFFALFFASKRWQRTAEYHRRVADVYRRWDPEQSANGNAALVHLREQYSDVIK